MVIIYSWGFSRSDGNVTCSLFREFCRADSKREPSTVSPYENVIRYEVHYICTVLYCTYNWGASVPIVFAVCTVQVGGENSEVQEFRIEGKKR